MVKLIVATLAAFFLLGCASQAQESRADAVLFHNQAIGVYLTLLTMAVSYTEKCYGVPEAARGRCASVVADMQSLNGEVVDAWTQFRDALTLGRDSTEAQEQLRRRLILFRAYVAENAVHPHLATHRA